MELKTKYQYTYFIYPFVIKENQYKMYLLKLLKDKNCNLKIFSKEKDLELYKYFVTGIREEMFFTFDFNKNKIEKLNNMELNAKATLLSKYRCCHFEYNLNDDIQARDLRDNEIFFNIQKVEIICFKPGICFLCMKTAIEDGKNFMDVLNFNYKFRDVKEETDKIGNYDKIHIQSSTFTDTEKLTEFIEQLTCCSVNNKETYLDIKKFFTYSYVCIDQEAWNMESDFEKIKENFAKYVNVLPADNHIQFDIDDIVAISKWKYAKLGITKLASTLFTSSADMNNYTLLPEQYENQYFYTYIWNLYRKIYLNKIELEFKYLNNINKVRKKFIDFNKHIWIQEITQDEIGAEYDKKLESVFEIEQGYSDIKNKYDILYKEKNIEKDMNTTFIISVILILSLIFNIINFFVLSKS